MTPHTADSSFFVSHMQGNCAVLSRKGRPSNLLVYNWFEHSETSVLLSSKTGCDFLSAIFEAVWHIKARNRQTIQIRQNNVSARSGMMNAASIQRGSPGVLLESISHAACSLPHIRWDIKPCHHMKPRKIWNNIVMSDLHSLNIRGPYHDAQDKPAWQARACATHLVLLEV